MKKIFNFLTIALLISSLLATKETSANWFTDLFSKSTTKKINDLKEDIEEAQEDIVEALEDIEEAENKIRVSEEKLKVLGYKKI